MRQGGNHMSPISRWSWILGLALTSLNGWAFEAGSPESRETYWQDFMQQGRRWREQRRLDEAQKNYLAAVSAAQQFGSGDTRLATSLNALALTYHELGRYEDAERSYREALQIWETASGSEDENV